MSVENNVFLNRKNMPSAKVWAEAIKQHGFAMEMDADFDVVEFEGFLPCTYKAEEAGFEYYAEEADLDELHQDGLLDDDEKKEIEGCDFLITFETGGCFREYITSMIASAVLTELSGGFLAEGGEPPFIHSKDAVNWAKDCVPSIEEEFD